MSASLDSADLVFPQYMDVGIGDTVGLKLGPERMGVGCVAYTAADSSGGGYHLAQCGRHLGATFSQPLNVQSS